MPDPQYTRINIETELGVWETRNVSFAERRAILKAVPPERRFMDPEHNVYIAHPLNLWCMISGDPYEG